MSYKKKLNIKKAIRTIGLYCLRTNLFKSMPDELYLKIKYYLCFGKKLNLDNPKSFNEKIQWLKLHDRNPRYPSLVDKAEVKKIIADKIGTKHIIKTYGVWNSFSEIDFSSLPNQFVIKCTHDSSSVIICSDKRVFNYDESNRILTTGLSCDFYKLGREWVYKDIKPRIIAEELITDSDNSYELRDYKFFCFNGQVKCFKVDFDRFSNHHANYYDIDGNILPFEEVVCPSDPQKIIKLPLNLSEMIKMAEVLSEGIPFVRVDLYNAKGHIYFGEMTFYPASGFGLFNPEKWDSKLGEWIVLPS